MISLALILFGVFLRVYDIGSRYYFSGELGKELLFVKSLIETNTLPLVGLQTSHEWLYYGPIYYWILTPIYKIFNGDPMILFWVSFVVSLIGLVLNYKVISKVINKNVALMSTVFISLSPFYIWQTRLSKLHTFFFMLSPLLIYSLYKLWKKDNKYIFVAGFIFGLFFSFHFSQIPMLLVIVFILFIRKYRLNDYLMFVSGLAIPNIGLILKDYKILAWLPYRALGFSNENGFKTITSFNEFFGRMFFWDQKFWYMGTLVSAVVLYLYVKKYRNYYLTDFVHFYLIASTFVFTFSLILHRNPPVHYFLPILPNIFYMLSILLDKLKNKLLVYVVFVIFLFLSVFMYEANKPDDYVPYQKQLDIASKIGLNYKGKTINLKRVGPYDYFPDNYSQNYMYLVLRQGVKIDPNSNLTIIVNDNENIKTK